MSTAFQIVTPNSILGVTIGTFILVMFQFLTPICRCWSKKIASNKKTMFKPLCFLPKCGIICKIL